MKIKYLNQSRLTPFEVSTTRSLSSQLCTALNFDSLVKSMCLIAVSRICSSSNTFNPSTDNSAILVLPQLSILNLVFLDTSRVVKFVYATHNTSILGTVVMFNVLILTFHSFKYLSLPSLMVLNSVKAVTAASKNSK